jgi:cardiolipin synthase
MGISRRVAGVAAAGALALAGACVSAPPIHQVLAQTPAAPVRVKTPHGVVSHAEAERIIAELRRAAPQSDILGRHLAIEQALTGTPLSTGNKAVLLQDGPATYAAELSAIRAARRSVDVEMYIFEGGEVGREFAEALAARRKAGVAVRVIYDGVGSMDTPPGFFASMREAGIEVRAFNPVSPGTVVKKGVALDHRDHRKLIVVDGRAAFLGGINISHVYGPGPRGPAGSKPSGGSSGGAEAAGDEKNGGKVKADDLPWRDTQVEIEGPAVAQLERLFVEQWARVEKRAVPPEARDAPAVPAAGHAVVRAIAGTPDDGVDAAYVALVSAIESAEKSVRITNAYFVPTEDLLGALERAARRGVDVELILPSRLDTWVVLAAGRSYYTELLEAGVKIHEREGSLLHAKTATVDGVWSTVGSTNLDYRSLSHNDELNVVILGADFAARMEAVFADDLAHSKAIAREAWARRGIVERLRELAARLSARFL